MFVPHIYPQYSDDGIVWGRIPSSGLPTELRMIWKRREESLGINEKDERKKKNNDLSFLA